MIQRSFLVGTSHSIDVIRGVTLNGSDVKGGVAYCVDILSSNDTFAQTNTHIRM